MSDDVPARPRGRARSRSFIAEDDDPIDPETGLPKAALQRRSPASPGSRTRGGHSGALRGNALNIVSNLGAALHGPGHPGGESHTGISPRSDEEAEAEAEERRLAAALRASGGSTGRGAGGAGAGAGLAATGPASKKKKKKEEICVRLLLLGDSGVGKTSLINRYTEGNFKNTIMTAGVDYRVSHITVDGRKVKLQIWDTAGQERFHVITRAYYKGAHGIVLVYDVSDVARELSFKNVRYWMDTIRQHGDPTGVDKVLVGNKVDLPGPKIEASRGRALADQFGLKHFNTSAKTGSGVKQCFTAITRDIVKRMAAGDAAAAASTATTTSESKGDEGGKKGKDKKCAIM